ncbi:cryptochrome/photolyase family protein [Alphaproteobacteria bacterium]|jgi:deoxyribodipyrimidine photolyase-related protein|nr:cryptochrome/photolyase family protein [Alphaproteobacteria bacterium]MDA9765138.1 cryptochrome/photolyase family protein [Alphaproteobacteria bacterium]
MSTLRLILGDQLSPEISSLKDADKSRDIILLCEVFDEAVYVKHHQKKIAFLFSAMRHFAASLSDAGWNVDYVRLDQDGNSHSFSGEVARAVERHAPESVIATFASEWRVLTEMRDWENTLPCAVELRDDDRFYCSLDEFATWADGRKQLRMEYFYRELRRKTGILMSGNDPIGGQWNYDAENRGRAPDGLEVPKHTSFVPDEITNEVLNLVEDRFGDHFGKLRPFEFAVTHEQAAYVLDRFIAERLPLFGTYQDAMVEGEPFMFHAHIGLYLNCGLLSPQQAIIAAENAYHAGAAPLNATEGFIRQILGWREFVRGLYWLKMPEYAEQNALEAHRPLPAFFWTADTKMNCLKQCVSETRDHAYAHHIQRLMVLGNFALLAGLSPKEVNEWFMIVYADAYEWVELPNVSGMALYADGGVLASKPYASGGAYIERMSNYCRSCHYKVKQKNGEQACPFNYLYWDFLIRHQDRLSGNARMGMMYRTLAKMSDEKRAAILTDSQRFLSELS